MDQKQYDRAILELRNAARLKPTDAEVYYQAGLAYLALGDFRVAYGSLLKATELDPKHAAAQSKLAELIGSSVTNTRDPQALKDAEARVKSVLAMVPDSGEALTALGRTEYLLGKPEDAMKHLEEALAKGPQNLQAAWSLAMIKVRDKDFASAEQILKKVAGDSPKSPEAELALARFYASTGRPADAEGALHRALNINSKFGPALLDLARLEVSLGKKEEAEKTLATLSALPDREYRPLHATYLFEQGKQDEAIREFEQLAAADPTDREAFSRLTSAYFFAKRFPDAERVVNTALRKSPKDTTALIERSKLYLITAKFAEAEADLNQVLAFNPNSATARYLLAKVFVARGQPLQARQQLSKAIDYDPNLLAARIELAEMLTAEKDGKAALEVLDAASGSQKQRMAVVVATNWALFATGDHIELRKRLDSALARFGRTPDLVLQDGILKFQKKDMPGARKSLEEVLAARPDDILALDTLGRTFVLEKRPEIGLRTVEQYASRRSSSATMQDLLGNWMARSGHPDKARTAYNAAVAADPSLFDARINLARLDGAEGKFDSARQILTSLASTAGTARAQADTETLFGELEEKAGSTSAAISHYRKAIDAIPDDALALNNLAYTLANSTDQVDEALKYAQRAKELAPKASMVEDTIGWAFYKKGLYDNAVIHLRNASMQNADPVCRYHLAMAYLKTGDRQRGRQVLDEARRINPNLPEATAAAQVLASAVLRN